MVFKGVLQTCESALGTAQSPARINTAIDAVLAVVAKLRDNDNAIRVWLVFRWQG